MKGLWRELVVWSDPEAPRAPEGRRIANLPALLEISDRHGVLPAVVANVSGSAQSHGPEARAHLERARAKLVGYAAVAMQVRSQWGELEAAFRAAGVQGTVLKGPDFADELYAPGLRPFRDLDVIVRREDFAAAQERVELAGYLPLRQGTKYSGGYGQQAFARADGRGGAVELHWNLVNSPTLRRSLNAGIDDLPRRADGALSHEGRLVVAAVHAAAGHQFDRLSLLCDIRQIVRRGPLDAALLRGALERTGAQLAAHTSLSLAAEVLGHGASGELLKALGLRVGGVRRLVAWGLTRRRVLADPAGGWGSLCRQGYRQLLKWGLGRATS
jgi:hypothetical protein